VMCDSVMCYILKTSSVNIRAIKFTVKMFSRFLRQLIAILAWNYVSSLPFVPGLLSAMNDDILKNKYHCKFLFRKRYGERINYQGDICNCAKAYEWMFVGAILKENLDKQPPKSEFRTYKVGAFGEKKVICDPAKREGNSNGISWYTTEIPGFGYFFGFAEIISYGPSLEIGLGTQDRTDFQVYPSSFDTREMDNNETYLAVWCCNDKMRPTSKPTSTPAPSPSRRTTYLPSMKTTPAPAIKTTYAPSQATTSVPLKTTYSPTLTMSPAPPMETTYAPSQATTSVPMKTTNSPLKMSPAPPMKVTYAPSRET
jgi:hypothetical protein